MLGLSSSVNAIEALMAKKLPIEYNQYRYSGKKFKVLTRKLKEVLQDEVDSLIKETGMFCPPFDPTRISRVGKARIEFRFAPKDKVGVEATIEPFNEGFIITLNEELQDPRLRYRMRADIAHELMHIFFYDISDMPPKRLGGPQQSVRDSRINPIEEDICRHLVREFLMPRFSLNNILDNKKYLKKPSIKALKYLKSIYQVSSQIVAYRMIKDLSIWDAIFIKSESMEGGFTIRLRLKGCYPGYKRLKIPSYVPINNEKYKFLISHLTKAITSTNVQSNPYIQSIQLDGKTFKFESTKDTINPISIVTLISPQTNTIRLSKYV
jgi:Zn-dependent peptidase ImmA (M78 family)